MIKITLPDGHYYDEMLTAQGEQRPHYNACGNGFATPIKFSSGRKKRKRNCFFTVSASPLTFTARMRGPSG